MSKVFDYVQSQFNIFKIKVKVVFKQKTFRVQYFYYKCVKFEFLFFRQKFMSGGHTNWPWPWASLYDIYNYNIESYNFVANCFGFCLILGKNLKLYSIFVKITKISGCFGRIDLDLDL